MDAAILGAVFAVLMGWSIWAGMNGRGCAGYGYREDIVSGDVSQERHPLAHRRPGAADRGFPSAGVGAVTIARALASAIW